MPKATMECPEHGSGRAGRCRAGSIGGASAALGAALAALLLLGSCSEDDHPVRSDGNDPGPFVIGDTVAVPLQAAPGETYHDPQADLTFAFPQGAAGTLTYGELVAAPGRPWSAGRGLYLAYHGAEEVQLQVPFAEQGATVLLTYERPFGSWSQRAWQRWFALPVADTIRAPGGDSLRIWLGKPGGEIKDECEGSGAHWLFAFPAGSGFADSLAAVAAAARAYIDAWLDSLDAATRARVTARMATELPAVFYPDGNYYTGFARICPTGRRVPQARIGLRPDAAPGVIAHQIGHYAMHLLAGDAAYAAMEREMPYDSGIGVFQMGRHGLIEDYAHYHEYLLTGAVTGAGDPRTPQSFFGSEAPDPAETDVPSLEGFGVLLFDALTRRDSLRVSLSGSEMRVPPAGLSYAQLAAEIFSAGARDMNQLRTWIAIALAGQESRPRPRRPAAGFAATSHDGQLALLAASVGWVYSGYGRIVDGSGTPVAGARLWDRVSFAGRTYPVAAGGATSDGLGAFALHSIAPDSSTLHIESPSDTFSIASYRAWSRPTDEHYDLGDLMAWLSLDRFNRLQFQFKFDFAAQPEDSAAGVTLDFDSPIRCSRANFARDRIWIDEPYYFYCSPAGGMEDCWVLDALEIDYSLETGYLDSLHINLRNRAAAPAQLVLDLAGELQASTSGITSVYFGRFDGVAAEELAARFAIEYDHPASGRFCEEDLRGTQQLLEIRAYRG